MLFGELAECVAGWPGRCATSPDATLRLLRRDALHYRRNHDPQHLRDHQVGHVNSKHPNRQSERRNQKRSETLAPVVHGKTSCNSPTKTAQIQFQQSSMSAVALKNSASLRKLQPNLLNRNSQFWRSIAQIQVEKRSSQQHPPRWRWIPDPHPNWKRAGLED